MSCFSLLHTFMLLNLCGAISMQIIERQLMSQAEYDEVSRKALRLFEYGQVICFS